jgi:serine/threonine protein kinase
VLIKADESAVIADFGLSLIKVDVSSRSTAVLITGTKRWMAPERMKGRRLAQPVDIYAWAMTAYEARCIDVCCGRGLTDALLHRSLLVWSHLEQLTKVFSTSSWCERKKDPNVQMSRVPLKSV